MIKKLSPNYFPSDTSMREREMVNPTGKVMLGPDHALVFKIKDADTCLVLFDTKDSIMRSLMLDILKDMAKNAFPPSMRFFDIRESFQLSDPVETDEEGFSLFWQTDLITQKKDEIWLRFFRKDLK
jgi:hypothetical protein